MTNLTVILRHHVELYIKLIRIDVTVPSKHTWVWAVKIFMIKNCQGFMTKNY